MEQDKQFPLAHALEIFGGRWRLLIVYSLKDGPKRFSDLEKTIHISRRILSANLRKLKEIGIVSRTAYPEVPPRVTYELTDDGRSLQRIICELQQLGKTINAHQAAIK